MVERTPAESALLARGYRRHGPSVYKPESELYQRVLRPLDASINVWRHALPEGREQWEIELYANRADDLALKVAIYPLDDATLAERLPALEAELEPLASCARIRT